MKEALNTSKIGIPLETAGVYLPDIHIIGGGSAPPYDMNWDMFSNYFTPIHRVQHCKKKEVFFVTAIKNLRKKINFISLNNDFQNGDISDEEFESEIEKNPEKYVINVFNASTVDDINILYEVIDDIKERFNEDEIAETFSIDVSNKTYNIEKVK